MENEDTLQETGSRPRGGLRLVWSRPGGGRLPRPAHLARPQVCAQRRWRINLALAIELHLRGDDGLTDQEFLTSFSSPPAG